jgi:hypothetical protein
MAKVIQTKINKYPQELALRSGEFFLLPELSTPPIITSQPSNNLLQYTWVESVEPDSSKIVYQPATQRDNKYTAVQGTEVSFILYAMDPSNVTNFNSDEHLKYVWKKDEAPITGLNAANNGKGINGLFLNQQGSTVDATGRYTCEISNQYGTVASEPLDLEIINPLDHPKLYKNLIINSSADGGVSEWQADSDILTKTFGDDIWITGNYASLPPFYYYDFPNDQVKNIPIDFRFSQGNHSSLFYGLWYEWKQKDDNILNLDVQSNPNDYLEGWQTWYLAGFPAQIVDNEDVSDFAGFFPGLKWMDKYNKNEGSKLIGLHKESDRQILNYFTRDRIKFKKFGGNSISRLSQTVDLSEAADLIDGIVSGVQSITAEFFAYVGAGITRYQIKAVPSGSTDISGSIYNWYSLDSQDYFDRITANKDTRIKLEPNTPIEIIPIVDDQTQVDLIFKKENGIVLDQHTILGPNEVDVFAIKEKVYLPISLYSVFDMFIVNNNPIKIFGQTYTTTEALASLMSDNGEKPIIEEINNTTTIIKQDASRTLKNTMTHQVMSYRMVVVE